jgi:hypothetical protein
LINRVTVAAEEVPTELVATTLNVVAASAAVGVPEITHVVAFKLKVLGNFFALGDPGSIPQAVIADPLPFRVKGATFICEFTVPSAPRMPTPLT